MEEEKVLLTKEEVDARLEEINPIVEEYFSLSFLKELYYAQEEGFIDLEGDFCYPKGWISDARISEQ